MVVDRWADRLVDDRERGFGYQRSDLHEVYTWIFGNGGFCFGFGDMASVFSFLPAVLLLLASFQ